MKKRGTFTNESLQASKAGPVAAGKKTSLPKQDPFFSQLIATGKPNWKIAPKEVKSRYRGVFMVLFSIPFIVIPGWEIFKRVSGRSTKKVQEGELTEDNSFRKFGEVEKWKTEKDSLMYKIFGKDFYLEGFTAKTMGNAKEDTVDRKA